MFHFIDNLSPFPVYNACGDFKYLQSLDSSGSIHPYGYNNVKNFFLGVVSHTQCDVVSLMLLVICVPGNLPVS